MNRSTEVELVDEMFSIEELEQRETPWQLVVRVLVQLFVHELHLRLHLVADHPGRRMSLGGGESDGNQRDGPARDRRP